MTSWSIPEHGIRVGDYHYYTLFTSRDSGNTPVGAIVYHALEDGTWCGGAIKWGTPPQAPYDQARWTLHSLRPLHVEPSIRCVSGPDGTSHEDNGITHGWIRGDVWEPAGPLPEWAR